MEFKKNWYQSKTLWINVVATVAILLQAVTGNEVLDADTQTTLLAMINILLRFMTKAPII